MKFLYPSDYCCIVTIHPNIWFCKNCKVGHNRLYVSNVIKEKYCPNCVPKDIEEKAIDINECREVIKK